jgi:hypothetical protein
MPSAKPTAASRPNSRAPSSSPAPDAASSRLTQWSATSRLELQTRVDGERKPTCKRWVTRAREDGDEIPGDISTDAGERDSTASVFGWFGVQRETLVAELADASGARTAPQNLSPRFGAPDRAAPNIGFSSHF